MFNYIQRSSGAQSTFVEFEPLKSFTNAVFVTSSTLNERKLNAVSSFAKGTPKNLIKVNEPEFLTKVFIFAPDTHPDAEQ